MEPETEYEAKPIVVQHLRDTVPDSTDHAGTKRPDFKPISEARRTTPSFTPLKLQYQAEPEILLAPELACKPLAIFQHFLPDWLLERVAGYTNARGSMGRAEAEKNAQRVHAESGSWKPRRPIREWQNTSLNEILGFLGKRKLGAISDHYWKRMKQRQCGYCSRVNGNILEEGPANKKARVLQERSPNLNTGIASPEKAIKRPKWGCKECDINLCKQGNDCWHQWHNDPLET